MPPRFRKTDSPGRTTERAARPAVAKIGSAASALAGGTAIDGAGNLVVHGTVLAPIIHDQDVIVGRNCRVAGKIRARSIIVEGEVDGDLYATDFIRVAETGRVKGDLHAARVGALGGSQLRGKIVMRHRADQVQTLDDPSVHRLLTQL